MAYRKIIPTILPRTRFRYRGHISKKKKKKGKKTIITFRCSTVGRHARLSNFIFWYFSKRCDRHTLHVSCDWKRHGKFLSGNTFFIIFCFFFSFFRKLEEIEGVADRQLTNVPCQLLVSLAVVVYPRYRVSSCTLCEFRMTGFRYAISETQMQ